MGIARMLVDEFGPGAAGTIAGHIDGLHRHSERTGLRQSALKCARHAIEAAAGRRAGDDLHGTFRRPDVTHAGYFLSTPKPPSTLAQSTTSSLYNLSKKLALPPAGGGTAEPRWANRLTTSGSLSATFKALLSVSMIGAGVPLGADSPNQTVRLNCGMPASAVVGTSGTIGERLSLVTA